MFPFTKSDFWRLLAAALILAGTLLSGIIASRVAAAPRQDIIESPGHTGNIYLQSTELLGASAMTSGTAWVWRMPLRVNALDPVVGLEVAGEAVSVPFQSRLELSPGVLLHAGENQVRVRAVTDTRVHERTFKVIVEPLEEIAALPGAYINNQRILIFRPVDRGEDVLLPEALLEVGGGAPALYDARLARPLRGALMYEFLVEVSAFSPIRQIKINGQVAAQPHNTWAQAKSQVVLRPDGIVVEVEASTDFATVRERFPLELAATALPGAPLYVPNAPGDAKSGAGAAGRGEPEPAQPASAAPAQPANAAPSSADPGAAEAPVTR